MISRCLFTVIALLLPASSLSQSLYEVPQGVETRWISFENPTGAKGQGGTAAGGRKGSFFKPLKAGETMTLADIKGPGVIRRIWATVRGVPEILRGMVIRFYWDDQPRPSVEAPLQDFFGVPFARQVRFESSFFSNPEGRSLNCLIPMPFRKRARHALHSTRSSLMPTEWRTSIGSPCLDRARGPEDHPG